LTDILSGGTVPHTFLFSALGGVYLSVCHPLYFTLEKRVPDTYQMGGWMGLTTGLGCGGEGKNIC
jgi:hypothetical protein